VEEVLVMDARRFDTVAATIARRGLLGAALGMSNVLALRTDGRAGPVACLKKQPDERCRRNSECCSGRCRIKKNRTRGRCRCSQLLKPCFENQDWCGDITGLSGSIVCSDKNGFDHIVCCVSNTGPCQSDNDCCSELTCNAGECGPPL
jgi:hypothetical protein